MCRYILSFIHELARQRTVQMMGYLLFGIVFHVFNLRVDSRKSRSTAARMCWRNPDITRVKTRARVEQIQRWHHVVLRLICSGQACIISACSVCTKLQQQPDLQKK